MRCNMENIDEKIEQLNLDILQKLKQLKVLLKEKNEIMARYKDASSTEKILIEKEMIESKQKFEMLSKEVDDLTAEIEKLKKI